MTVTSPPAPDVELTWQSELFSAAPAFRRTAVADARERLSPRAAFQEVLWGRATLVDIRPEAQRRTEGALPTSLTPLAIEHSTLGARLDPRGDARLPIASTDLRVIVICQEGRDSSHAVETLGRLGVRHATDVIGGFAAWRSLGLPVAA
ncbi:rhodanese-like domain-containing protein [Flexivirga oryzae]|uniref:Rhodanese-related sulfurtransferase n=1 Tax=Flexivirga oryzae TaxID=1794944 RepID=A0A839N6N8_9MICO|nr:rhodanese-like domain-containing protein [Flexivirga oryzae]MBB2893410.1 rhodanese-related sulfurtransferase [Flexivirga oryzae]